MAGVRPVAARIVLGWKWGHAVSADRPDQLFAGPRPGHLGKAGKATPAKRPVPAKGSRFALGKLPIFGKAKAAKLPPAPPSLSPPPKPSAKAPQAAPKPVPSSGRSAGGGGGSGRGMRWGLRLGTLIHWGLVVAIWCGVGLGAVLAYFALDLPDISKVAQFERRASVTVLAADGTEFARFGDLHGTTLSVKDLPPHLIQAVLAIEDRRFYSHFGIDPIGLARAVYVNWRSGRATQGGSTITQQLAKNLFLTAEKSLKRKIQEAMLALWLERRFTKDQILTAYLNRVYLGAGTFGVDAAARTYFGKPATQVDMRESAVLAALLKAPSRYAPTTNPDESAERARIVLAAMADAGFITPQAAENARNTPPVPRRKPGGDGRYFADWVTDLVSGFVGSGHGDVIVRTTLDLKMQRAAEQRLETLLATAGPSANVRQGALVAMSPDGAVRALVGGRDYDSSEFNRAIQAQRQPGSAFKPFVYLAGLEAGWTPDTLIEDAPIQIGTWSPGNYDGKYRGPITLATALAHSSNTATVRLIEKVGTERVRHLAAALGIGTPMIKDLSLALGTSEVTLLDLVRAYAGIANRGAPVWAYAITEIRDRDGTVLYRRQGGGSAAVVDPALAVQLARMMAGVIEFGTGKSAKLDRPAAAKSGTTQEYRDAWFVGFTADLVAGVWLGNDNNEAMKRVTGGTLPAKLWQGFMMDAHAGKPPRPLPGLDGAPAWTSPVAAAGGGMPGAIPAGQPGLAPVGAAPATRGDSGIGSLISRLVGGGSAPKGQPDYGTSQR